MKLKAPEWMAAAIDSAQRAQIYIIAQPGPLVFVIKEGNKDETMKTSLGFPHTCSCSEGVMRHYCIHISFLLQRKYRLSPDHPWLTRTSLTDSELESLLQLRHLDNSQPVSRARRPVLKDAEQRRLQQGAPPPENMRKRNPLTAADSCPICLEGFFTEDLQEVNYATLPFCACCGNSTHTRCIQMYIQHARQTKAKELCPYCRSPYEDGRQYEQTEKPQNALKACARCENKLESIAIKRVVSAERYCTTCFITMNPGVYEKKGRKIVYKQRQNNQGQSRERTLEFYRRFAALQYRDITMEDHNFLLELENPYMVDIAKKQQRFPSYLIWDCFKQSSCIEYPSMDPDTRCFLCGGFHPTLSNLLVPKEGGILDLSQFSLALDFDSVVMLLLEQGEQRISTSSVQDLINNNVFLELPCVHVVHKVCAILGSLVCRVEAIFKSQHSCNERQLPDCKVKMFPDYCTSCRTPFIVEWLRGSRLAAKSLQIVKSPAEKESATRGQLPSTNYDGILSVTNIPLPDTQIRQSNSSIARSKSIVQRPQNKGRSVPLQNASIATNTLLHAAEPVLSMGIIVRPV